MTGGCITIFHKLQVTAYLRVMKFVQWAMRSIEEKEVIKYKRKYQRVAQVMSYDYIYPLLNFGHNFIPPVLLFTFILRDQLLFFSLNKFVLKDDHIWKTSTASYK